MRDPPDIDGRRQEAVREHLESIAPYYTPEWDPDADDPGSALLAAFAEITEEVLTRLDRVPEKQFVSFLDSLGVRRMPPRPSRVPLVVTVADDADGNVEVPAGTRAVAESTDSRPEQVFEIGSGEGFEATPSNVTRLYSVDPDTDAIFDHREILTGGPDTRLFDGENCQEHVLYVGDGDLLNLGAGSMLRVTMETDTPERVLTDCFVWEFYGELDVDGETKTGWHPFHPRTDDSPEPCPWSTLRPVEAFWTDEHRRDRVKSRGWDLGDHAPDRRRRLLASIAADVSGPSYHGVETGGTHTSGSNASERLLPQNLFPPGAVNDEFARALRGELRSLREKLLSVSETARAERRERAGSTVEIPLQLPGPTAERTVSGIESRWIRCRLSKEVLARDVFDVEVQSVDLDVGTEVANGSGLAPDAMLSNDVPLPMDGTDGDLYPFGPVPQMRASFYVASEEAFTKADTAVAMWFEPPVGDANGADESVDVSWEYWNGDGWTRLADVTDGTEGLTGTGAVRFDVPHDLEPRRVSGHHGHWIRARLVGGDYGRIRYEETSRGSWERVTTDVHPPRFGGVTLRYAQADAPDHLLRYNNRSFSDDLSDGEQTPFSPFAGLSDASQTLYVGFDGPLDGGPIHLYLPQQETEYPDGFDPRVRWEYRTATDGGEWSRLDVEDGTRGLCQSGIVRLTVPAETVACELFGRELHWIRARVTGDEFASPADTLFVHRFRREITTPRSVPEPHRPTVRTERPTYEPVETPPRLRSLHVNTGWAYNSRTVRAETLGSSDGSRSQQFDLDNPSVTSEPAEVWVDELAGLPAERRRELAETRPSAVEAVTGSDGGIREFWIRWAEVEDFLGSGADDRQYTLDRAAGTVTFGDGIHGKIPPRGRENVRASYRIGGGTDGNVATHAITGLRRSIPFVDSVTNPEPAGGGADEESAERVRTRAPRRLRDRGRSVFAVDFERIAVDAAGELARVKCIAGRAGVDDRVSGQVTVLVVPDARESRPVPSEALKRQVRAALRDRAPATVVESDRDRLAVMGPRFVDVSVEATIEPTAVESRSALEEDVVRTLTSFLHPLSGGPERDGWAFGALPHRSDLYALLEGIDRVDHVVDLSLTVEGAEDAVTVTEGALTPRVAPDTLVFSGTHDITVTGGR